MLSDNIAMAENFAEVTCANFNTSAALNAQPKSHDKAFKCGNMLAKAIKRFTAPEYYDIPPYQYAFSSAFLFILPLLSCLDSYPLVDRIQIVQMTLIIMIIATNVVLAFILSSLPQYKIRFCIIFYSMLLLFYYVCGFTESIHKVMNRSSQVRSVSELMVTYCIGPISWYMAQSMKKKIHLKSLMKGIINLVIKRLMKEDKERKHMKEDKERKQMKDMISFRITISIE